MSDLFYCSTKWAFHVNRRSVINLINNRIRFCRIRPAFWYAGVQVTTYITSMNDCVHIYLVLSFKIISLVGRNCTLIICVITLLRNLFTLLRERIWCRTLKHHWCWKCFYLRKISDEYYTYSYQNGDKCIPMKYIRRRCSWNFSYTQQCMLKWFAHYCWKFAYSMWPRMKIYRKEISNDRNVRDTSWNLTMFGTIFNAADETIPVQNNSVRISLHTSSGEYYVHNFT